VRESPAYQIVRVESISSFSDSGSAEKNLTKASWKRDVGFSYLMQKEHFHRKNMKTEISFVYRTSFVGKVLVYVLKIHFKSDRYISI
jgi:hypothetical protein